MGRGHDAALRAGPRAGVARSFRRAALLALLLVGGCLRARGTPDEPVVVSVELEGVKAVDESELRDRLATRASDRFRWGETRRLDPDAVASDRRRVAAFYKERGYYRATVEDVEVVPKGKGRVRVVFDVREGDPVRVTRVDVEGLDAAPEARARAGALTLKPGQVFTWTAFDAARASPARRSSRRGCPLSSTSATSPASGSNARTRPIGGEPDADHTAESRLVKRNARAVPPLRGIRSASASGPREGGAGRALSDACLSPPQAATASASAISRRNV